MNLQSFSENYSRDIYGATFRVIDETVYWAAGETTSDDFQFDGTWIKALNCMTCVINWLSFLTVMK